MLGIAVSSSHAGGGPENVLLVVNARSWASRTVANQYIHLRRIPPDNVVYLDWPHSVYETTLKVFRDELLRPVFTEIEKRKLAAQIDYIVYSSDFPYAVDFSGTAPARDKFPTASITGLTYLAMLSPDNVADFRAPNANWYAAKASSDDNVRRARAFRSQYQWNRNGARVEDGGQTYVLSTMLGYTSGRGNSAAEVLQSLRRSVLADGTRPQGTIYYADSGDTHRSGTRQPGFAAAIRQLEQLGVRAEEINATAPAGKDDILGAMLGAASISWDSAGNRVVPGAIIENFTSYGGILRRNVSQTPISAFVRHGAAGTSGTVIEPYALAAKFPDPLLHVYYASGCSLAEAFYQSVRSPYQLLILGDPLCQPWAPIPAVTVSGVEPNETVRGTISITPNSVDGADSNLQPARFQLYIDGQLVAGAEPGTSFPMDTTALSDGYHELRIVAIEQSPIEAQGRILVPIIVDNHGRNPVCKRIGAGGPDVPWGSAVSLEVSAPGAERIVVLENRRPLAEVKSEKGTVAIPTSSFGFGQIQLRAVAIYQDGEQTAPAVSPPLQLRIVTPSEQSGRAAPPSGAEPGLVVSTSDHGPQRVAQGRPSEWLAELGAAREMPFRIEGHFQVAKAGIHQVQLEYHGTVELRINQRLAFRETHESVMRSYVPLALGEGWHELELRGKLDDVTNFQVEMGDVGTRRIDPARFVSTLQQ